MRHTLSLCWLRRDLRCHDHHALAQATADSDSVLPVFVFDTTLLRQLPRPDDRRVEFIWHSVAALKAQLQSQGRDLWVLHGEPEQCIPELAQSLGAQAVYANHDDDPEALARDAAVAARLQAQGQIWRSFKDHVIFERSEILNQSGRPYTVFTPYKKAWLAALRPELLQAHEVQMQRLQTRPAQPMPSLADLGFTHTNLLSLGIRPGPEGAQQTWQEFLPRLQDYALRRDFPAQKGPSYLSVHLRFGTLSIRELVATVREMDNLGAQTWLSELIWREFYHMLLAQFPDGIHQSFRPEFRHLVFPNPPDWFAAWCAGQTGYPLVDAAMRQLKQTGYMHNRLRMVAAAFLVKDLLIDWRWGERYFAEHLLDFDLAANNGGWQWAASTGCDAQPYFRIFNPSTQAQRFDPEAKFIRRYVPELAALPNHYIHQPWTWPAAEQQRAGWRLGQDYPAPIVDHALMRTQALALFKQAKEHGLKA